MQKPSIFGVRSPKGEKVTPPGDWGISKIASIKTLPPFMAES